MPTTVSDAGELENKVEKAGPGDEIIARGGTYDMSSRWKVESGGTENQRLVIRAADGERPHIRFAAGRDNPKDDSGIQFRSPYVTFSGFEVSRSGWKGVNTDGDAHDVILENLNVHHCNRWGIMNNGQENVVFRNCDSHDHFDHQNSGDHSDGFNMTGQPGKRARNGTIVNCRAWNNGDDGFDFWRSEDHEIRYCQAWNNGRGEKGNGLGFKLGGEDEGGKHLIHHCAAWDNEMRGFDWNTTDNYLEVYNCTAFNNPINYRFNDKHGNNHKFTLRNNISYNGDVVVHDNVDDRYNSWNLNISDPQFRSLDPNSDDFLRLSEGSDAIDAGVDVGLDYNGTAPDLGAFEYGGGGPTGPTTTTSFVQPVITAGEVTLDASDAALTGTKLESQHDGYNGEGYLNAAEDSGAVCSWSIEVSRGGRYDVVIRYANGTSSSRTALLRAGDSETEITFPSTGSWSSWDTISATVELPGGKVDVEIETTGEDAGNVDAVHISGPGYARPAEGASNWHAPLNRNFAAMEADVRTLADAVGSLDGGTRPTVGGKGEDFTLSASDAALTGTKLESKHQGYNGEGYLNATRDSGAVISWSLDVGSGGQYDVEIRYANGASSSRTALLRAGNTETEIAFPSTGAWTSWETLSETVDLPSGQVDVEIETTGEDAGNVDVIYVSGSGNAGSDDGQDHTLAASDASTTDVNLESQHDGYNGEGYLNATADTGSVISWSLDAGSGGRYDVEVRYANGASSSRTAVLRAADSETEITFPSTGAWTSWETISETIELPSGQTDLEIETTGQDAGNVDLVRLSSTGYARPAEGREDWHVPLNDNFAAVETDVENIAKAVASLEGNDNESLYYNYVRPSAGIDEWDDPLNNNFASIESDIVDLAGRIGDLASSQGRRRTSNRETE